MNFQEYIKEKEKEKEEKETEMEKFCEKQERRLKIGLFFKIFIFHFFAKKNLLGF